ncbi:MAG: hypothetical protein AB7G75_25135 [Candidatus Binatia bacterium]
MTSQTTCPDFSLLSQFRDQELESREAGQISHHVASCPTCQTTIGHIDQTEERMRAAAFRAASQFVESPPHSSCLSPETIAAYVHHQLPSNVVATIETHVQTCDLCLGEIWEATRITAALSSTPPIPVPAALAAQVAATWQQASQTQTRSPQALSRIVIQVAKKGLKLIEQHLVEPFFDLQETLVALPAYRADTTPSVLDLTIQAGTTEIQAIALQEGDGLSLRMTLRGADQAALSGQRVFLRQAGHSIFSAKTDQEGTLRTPHLAPGVYEVSCSGLDASFLLELCS